MESLRRSVLERNLERLKATSVNPFLIACNLRIADTITDEDAGRTLNKSVPASERWGDLVTTIMKKSAEGVFQSFINVLLEESELEDLGEEMKGTLVTATIYRVMKTKQKNV